MCKTFEVDCRYNEKMQRIQRGLEGVVDELFTYSCPKFVAATPPRLDNLTVNSNQVQTAQLQCWCLDHQHQMTHTDLLICQHAMHSLFAMLGSFGFAAVSSCIDAVTRSCYILQVVSDTAQHIVYECHSNSHICESSSMLLPNHPVPYIDELQSFSQVIQISC